MRTFEEWKNPFKKKEIINYPPPAYPENPNDPYGEEIWVDKPFEFVDNEDIRFFTEKRDSGEYFISPMRYRFNAGGNLYQSSGIWKIHTFTTYIVNQEEKPDKILIFRNIDTIHLYSPIHDRFYQLLGNTPNCRGIRISWNEYRQRFLEFESGFKRIEEDKEK